MNTHSFLSEIPLNFSYVWEGLFSSYQFDVHPISERDRLTGPGVYIFAEMITGFFGNLSFYRPFYVGQTKDFARRLCDHEYFETAFKMGATHVHTFRHYQEWKRKEIEDDLVWRHNPPFNIQKKQKFLFPKLLRHALR